MQQTFPASKESKIIIKQASGDLNVQSWDQPSIEIVSDGSIVGLYQEENVVRIVSCDDDLALRVPPDTEIQAESVAGDVSIARVRRVELQHIDGDVTLEHIGDGVDIEQIGEAIALTQIAGDLVVKNASSLRARREIDGDAVFTDVALVEMENVGGDLVLKHSEAVVIGSVGGDVAIEGIADTLSCGNIGGDGQIEGSAQAELTIGNVGGDLAVTHAASMRLGSVGGDCVVRNAQKMIEIGNIGGDASFNAIGAVQAGNIGGDASLKGVQGSLDIGSIGSDLLLEAAFPEGSSARLHVGGDASVRLPAHPDLNIRAFVGGDISGPSTAGGKNGNWVNLSYGNGAAQLELYVGGDLNLRGGDQPRNSSSSGGWGAEFASEMAELGQELGHLGQELEREIRGAFQQAGWGGAKWTESVTNKINEQMRRAQRKAEEQVRKAGERASKTAQQSPRMRVRFNDREWQLDPERLERIKAQASKAASEGISNAMEAVERAIGNLRMPTPPTPPTPPAPPARPGQPTPPDQPVPPAPHLPWQSDPAVSQNAPQQAQTPGNTGSSTSGPADAPDLDQEREAILRMIAEGRISPEEGDLLLEGLGG